MIPTVVRNALPYALAILVCGCEALTGLYREEVPATLALARDGATILAPDTVDHGTPFDVRFTSDESKCTDRVRDDVSIRSDSIVIASSVSRWNQCGDALWLMPHVVRVKVDAPGAYRIYLRGQKGGQGGAIVDTVVTRPLTVR